MLYYNYIMLYSVMLLYYIYYSLNIGTSRDLIDINNFNWNPVVVLKKIC